MVQSWKTLIFPIDFNDVVHFKGQLGVTLGAVFMKIMEDNGRKVKNGPPKRQRRRMALVMYITSPCVGPKRAQKQNISIFPMQYEAVKRATRTARKFMID